MPICQGCHRPFTFKGLAVHAAKQSNLACFLANNSQHSVESEPPVEDEDGTMQIDPDDVDNPELPPVPFEGDFFGTDYTADELPGWGDLRSSERSHGDGLPREVYEDDEDDEDWVHTDQGQEDLEDSDDEQELLERTEAARSIWEPDRSADPSPPSTSELAPSESDDPEPEAAEANMHDDTDNAAESSYYDLRQRVEAALQRPLVIKHYTSDKHPGAPVATGDADTASTGYTEYAAKLGASKNPYAPFAHKLEWDFVRWSKLRGPGSTACDELLAIDGVRT